MLILGGAGEWDQAGDANLYWYTVDAQWQPATLRGLSVYGALVGRQTAIGEPESATQDDSFSDWGWLAQVSYLFSNNFEPFVRADYTRVGPDLLSDSAASTYGTRDIYETAVGLNYYLHGQGAKFTVDLTYLPNGTPISSSGADIGAQTTDDAQFLARFQFQLQI